MLVHSGQVWVLTWGAEVVRMEVLGTGPDWVVLGEIPWPRSSVPPDEEITRRVYVTTAEQLALVGALDDRRGPE